MLHQHLPTNDQEHLININLLISMIVTDLLSTETDSYNVIYGIIEESEGVTGPVHFVNFQTPKQNQENRRVFLFERQQIDLLHELCVSKILQKRDEIINYSRFALIMSAWNEWGRTEDITKYLEKATKGDDTFILMIQKMLFGAPIILKDGQFERNIYKEQINFLTTFIREEKLINRLNHIKKNNKNLYNKNKVLVDEIIAFFN